MISAGCHYIIKDGCSYRWRRQHGGRTPATAIAAIAEKNMSRAAFTSTVYSATHCHYLLLSKAIDYKQVSVLVIHT